MFRRNILMRTAVGAGMFKQSQLQRYLWGFKDSDMHRLARQRPWWENAAIFVGLLLFINAASAAMYLGNRWYQSWRPSGNEIQIVREMDAKLFSRPDLAVAAVRMVLHYALSGTTTPFGAPMVAPAYLKTEAEELLNLVLTLHEDNPAVSIPDLWAMLTAKALARLGGPNVTIRRGRDGPPDDTPHEALLQFPPSLVAEDTRDVLNMKKVLSRAGFSLEQIVALISCNRNIGFHEAANFHTTEEIKPHVKRRPSLVGPNNDDFHLPDLIEKSTLDPYVFGGEYFDLLLDYDWKKEGIFKKSDNYHCSQKDRRREVVLLDPFSEKAIESQRRRLEAEQRAANTLDSAASDRRGAMTDKKGSLFGRSGEAQFIVGAGNTDGAEALKAAEIDKAMEEDIDVDDAGESMDPCDHISMRGVDVMLLDDALTRGWLYRFSENEITYYAAVSGVFSLIQERGYNSNKLREIGRML